MRTAEGALKAATEVCAPLLAYGGEVFPIASSCEALADVLRAHAALAAARADVADRHGLARDS